jgi:hypothetical protein
MENRPGFWIYLAATGAAAMIALMAGAVYLVTPAPQRGEANRLWGMVALALLASLLAAGIGVGLAVALGYFMLVALGESGLGVKFAPWIALIFATSVRAAVYLAVFAAGWSMVKPRDQLAEA